MGDRRVIHRKIIESDAFYALPEGAQSLYFHLYINADDDGFVNNASSIITRIRGGKAKLNCLIAARFVLEFGNIHVIKHWRVGNSLKNDRTKPPTYPDIAKMLWIKENRGYTDHPVPGCETLLERKTGIRLESDRNPVGIHLESQQNRIRTDKNKNGIRTESPGAVFDGLWELYPENRRGSRSAAKEAFRTEITSEEDERIAKENLVKWKASEQWNKDGGQYIPYLSNWLERGMWCAEPPKSNLPHGASGELGEAELEAIRRVLAMGNEDVGNEAEQC